MISNIEALKGKRFEVKMKHIEERMELIDEKAVHRALSQDDADDAFNSEEVEGDSGSDADSEESEPRLPRGVVVAFREAHGANLRVKKKNQLRFTKATNPIMADKLQFMLSGDIVCP
jgi:hypothetical protein